MCGIGGIISEDYSLKNSYLDWINNKQAHRGPDNNGVYYSDKIGMCHQRLSIIDLSKNSNQPYQFSNTVISFNGEIYNFKLLLNQKKYSILSNIKSDTSFFASAWNLYGMNILDDIVGMYSVSIFNKELNTLTLVTDEFGIKPIFYYQSNKYLLWASEFEALFSFIKNQRVDLNVCQRSLDHTYSFLSPFCGNTVIKQIKRLLPGERLVFDSKANLIKKTRHNILKSQDLSEGKMNSKKISDEISQTFISDVPIATLISGGIDSSYICSNLKRKNIFQKLYHYKHPSSEEGFISDTFYAEYLSKSINIRLNNVGSKKISKEILKNIFKSIKVSGDISAAIPLFEICEEIKRTSSCKVVLSGLGADEMFHGYRLHKIIAIKQLLLSKLHFLLKPLSSLFNSKLQYIFPKSFSRRAKITLGLLTKKNNNEIDAFIWGSSTSLIDQEFIDHYKKIGIINSSSFSRIVSLTFMHFLAANHLPISDSVSMAHSLEMRPVFLIKNLINKMTFKPSFNSIFVQKKELKNYLKNEFGEDFVKRPKAGFGVEPKLFSKEIIQWLLKIIETSNLCSSLLLKRIKKDLDNYNDPLYSRKLYGLISLAHSISLINRRILEIN